MKERVDTKSIKKHIKILEKRYRKNVGSHLFFPLADAYCKADMLDKAESLLREGLSYHPKYCSAKALLGEVLLKKGALKAAQEELEQVVQMVPENIMAHKHLLDIYSKIGSKEAYERELRIIQMIDHKKSLSEDLEMIASPGSNVLIGEAKKEGPMEAGDDQTMFEVKEISKGDSEETMSQEEVDHASGSKGGIFDFLFPLKEDEKGAVEEGFASEAESEATMDLNDISEAVILEGLEEAQGSEILEEAVEDIAGGVRLASEGEPPTGEDHTEATFGEEEGEHGLATATLAELYFSQGFMDKALEIYHKLLLQQPDNMEWMKRFQEIQDMHNNIEKGSHALSEASEQPKTKDKKEQILEVLEKWLKNCQEIKKSRSKG